jgi:acyl-coenzyme A thioesterase PaaI-like protein
MSEQGGTVDALAVHREAIPNRLGVTASFDDGDLHLHLTPRAEVLHHGVVRASVLSYMIDGIAGIYADEDAELWTLTSDMTVRTRAVPAPKTTTAACSILRRGRRTVTGSVEVTADDGTPIALGAVGFAKYPRKDTDPPKPFISPERAATLFSGERALSRPLREEAGIEAIDPQAGIVEVLVTQELRNPAGTLQGALVALVAEAAAEDLVQARFDRPMVVTDLDLRYLAKAQVGPVRTRARLLDDEPGAPVRIELFDTSTDTLTTLVYARAADAP